MKSGSKKDTNELLNESASIECRYLLELSKSKKKAQVLSIIATTSIIYRINKATLTTEQLLEKMHIQWRLAGGKLREDNSNNKDEVALVASTKKGGKKSGGGDKPQRENPNKDETCNHCNKKGHIKSTCWTKHPDKKPKSVKNIKSKQQGKSSVAAGALEDNKEEIILTVVKDENQYVYLDDKKVFKDKESIVEEVYTSKMQTEDITNAYHFCPVLGSNKYLNEEESEEEFLSNKDEHAIKFNRNNDNNDCKNQGCITSFGIGWNTQMQANSKQKSIVEAEANFCN
jgi:hypothetical protein